ncbi:uncharacterized protein b6 [Chironomus tepperi]|uniref:uncharacterized protein b6 n=1 Tax=Chironomus tepperi TaxID=113505 RepID=UPI00391F8829
MKRLLVNLIAILPVINCWTPLASHTASYTVQHSYPSLGSETEILKKSSNEIYSHDTSVDHLFESFHAKSNGYNVESPDACAFDKFAIDHESTIDYDTSTVKTMDQFTLCSWVRFTKHDGDHVIFTYSVHDEPREIQFWVSNVNSSSFVTLAVRGYSLYRLGYPFQMKKWHHTCTSWNGKTGEWQLWVKSERVGRGFYNRLVSHEIEAGGKAFTGGKSTTGKVCEGLHMEVTSLQLYSVALSAGKAHRDHKHHHVHKFDHDGEISTTTPLPRPTIVANQPINPLLANGQFPSRVKINFAGGQSPASTPAPATLNTHFNRGQYNIGARNLQHQLINNNAIHHYQSQSQFNPQPTPLPQQQQQINFPSSQPSSSSIQFPQNDALPFTSSYTGFGSHPANVEIIDESQLPTLRFKRQTKSSDKSVNVETKEQEKKKRDLITLTEVGDKFFDTDWYDGLAQFGGNDFKQHLSEHDNLEDEIKEHDREPAEGEVEAVRSYCNSCLIEPFESALVLPWKSAQPSSKVLRAKASKVCGDF